MSSSVPLTFPPTNTLTTATATAPTLNAPIPLPNPNTQDARYQPNFSTTILPHPQQDPFCPPVTATIAVFQAEYDNYNASKYGDKKHKVFITELMRGRIVNFLEEREVPGEGFNAQDKHWIKGKFMMHQNEVYTFDKDGAGNKQPLERLLCREQYHELLHDVHKSTGHKARDQMHRALKDRAVYTGITKDHIMKWVKHCPKCHKGGPATVNYAKRPRGRAAVPVDLLSPVRDPVRRVSKTRPLPRPVAATSTTPAPTAPAAYLPAPDNLDPLLQAAGMGQATIAAPAQQLETEGWEIQYGAVAEPMAAPVEDRALETLGTFEPMGLTGLNFFPTGPIPSPYDDPAFGTLVPFDPVGLTGFGMMEVGQQQADNTESGLRDLEVGAPGTFELVGPTDLNHDRLFEEFVNQDPALEEATGTFEPLPESTDLDMMVADQTEQPQKPDNAGNGQIDFQVGASGTLELMGPADLDSQLDELIRQDPALQTLVTLDLTGWTDFDLPTAMQTQQPEQQEQQQPQPQQPDNSNHYWQAQDLEVGEPGTFELVEPTDLDNRFWEDLVNEDPALREALGTLEPVPGLTDPIGFDPFLYNDEGL